MKLKKVIEGLDLAVCCAGRGAEAEVTGAYAGDLLSDVIANSKAGNVWVTMQVHVNIVAVAVLKDLSAIILVNGRTPAEDTLKKASEEKAGGCSSRGRACGSNLGYRPAQDEGGSGAQEPADNRGRQRHDAPIPDKQIPRAHIPTSGHGEHGHAVESPLFQF